MKVILTYPVPLNVWGHFRSSVKRFTQSFKDHPPGCDYELWVTCHWGERTDAITKLFFGIKTRYFEYHDNGCDIGSHQWVINTNVWKDTFFVSLATHAYFHRDGWLKRLVDAREKYGPGLYGVAASNEVRPHIRTSCFGLDALIWRDYKKVINSRELCSEFENGPESITNFVQENKEQVWQVTWDDEQGPHTWRLPEGVFRKGAQNAMLVWDRHTLLFEEADLEESKRLTELADGCEQPVSKF